MTRPKEISIFKFLTRVAIPLYIATSMLGCDQAKIEFKGNSVTPTEDPNQTSFELNDFLKPIDQEQVVKQDKLEQNISTLSFQIKLPNGNFLENLNLNQFQLFENKTLISQFKFSKNTLETKQVVDIIFAVDVTGSMTDTIDAAKIRLVNFIKRSRELGYHTRMCLITFGDYTVKKCDQFYDNDPANPATQSQVNKLIEQVNALKAAGAFNDPGGDDLNENPMGALIDASKAKWADNNQRFVILMTDDGFLYSPGNQGSIGSNAPKYTDVKAAIEKAQMKVFAVTPSYPGYNKPFGSYPSITSLSNGEWFNFADLLSGQITLDTILTRILNSVNTTFVAEYNVNEIPGLNPTTPINKKTMEVQLLNGAIGTVTSLSLKSNFPNGVTQGQKEFQISAKKIKKSSVVVYLNNAQINSGYLITDDNKIKFDQAPPSLAEVKIRFQFDQIKDAIEVKPILLNGKAKIDQVKVYINSHLVKSIDYTISKNADGKYTLLLKDSIFSTQDLYEINKKNELQIKVKYDINK